MRQRRQRLQVSTFPFLAVLLCAMGSLILLLLVIDRRAKIVARAKAMRAREQAAAEARAAAERAAAQQAEWEQRRRWLHEQLLHDDLQVRGTLQGVEKQAAAATAKVEAELARRRQLQEQLQAERASLARFEDELAASRAEVAHTAQQANASQAELASLTAELERMERTLADLRAARQRQQQTYSLVPYRGKRGDNRKPLYIECSGDDLIFHPDHLVLHGWQLTPSGLRDEIERRLARQRSATQAIAGKPEENAYLLMLIRPNGITTYYRTLATLKGLHFDFGYEFIDQDWILDFSEGDQAPKKQPWMTVEQTRQKQPPRSLANNAPLWGLRTGQSQNHAGASGEWQPSPNAKRPPEEPGLPAAGPVLGQPRGILATGSGSESPPFGGGSEGTEATNPGALMTGRPAVSVQAPGRPGGGSRLAAGTRAGKGALFANTLAGGADAAAAPATALGGNALTAPPSSPGVAEPAVAPGGSAESANGRALLASAPRATTNQLAAGRAVASNGPGELPRGENSGNPGNPGIGAAPAPMPSFVPGRAPAAAPGAAGSEAPSGSDVGRSGSAPGEPASRQALQGPPADPLDGWAARDSRGKPIRGVPLRSGPLVGNRDWIIPIECTADALVLPSSGQHIATADLSGKESGSNPLLETVQRMIARRQATLWPGEPPYRPMIRFRVWPDGLRSYYLAYPALEALHLPMSRENLDPEEEKAAGRQR